MIEQRSCTYSTKVKVNINVKYNVQRKRCPLHKTTAFQNLCHLQVYDLPKEFASRLYSI